MRNLVVLALLLLPWFLLTATAGWAQPNGDSAVSAVETAGGSLVKDVAALETSVYGQPTSDSLAARVGHLELTTLGSLQCGPLRARVDWLQHELHKPYSISPFKANNEQHESLRLSPEIEQRIPAAFRAQIAPIPQYSGSGLNAAAAREMGMQHDACACHYVHH